MVAAIFFALAVAAAVPAEHHIRSGDARIQHILVQGLEQSPTLHRLVEALDRSDVIVYIDEQQRLPALGGYLSHRVVALGGVRYLRVKLNSTGPISRVTAVLAHELQHALEVAQVAEARDLASLQQLFEKVGLAAACEQEGCFETRAARDVEHEVQGEMTRFRRPVR